MTDLTNSRSLPPVAYLAGVDGWSVSVPGRVAAWLEVNCRLREVRVRARGNDYQIDQVLIALSAAANQWRELASAPVLPRESTQAELESSNRWVVPQEAADLSGITASAVRLAIRESRLPAEKVGRRWKIRLQDLQAWRAER